ncbi:unnamed protein product [Trichobilharzia regenti]|nr:unnamed protein product [Trichobilharzia regenti]
MLLMDTLKMANNKPVLFISNKIVVDGKMIKTSNHYDENNNHNDDDNNNSCNNDQNNDYSLKVFNEPTVLSYEGLLTLGDKSVNQKKEFFGRLPKVIPLFEPVSWWD